MCARMKHLPKVLLDYRVPPEALARGNRNRQILFRVKDKEGYQVGIWDGNARRENLKTTWKDWRNTTVPAASIFEGGKEFPLAEGAVLWGIYRMCGETPVVKIVTRPPLTEAEAAVHPRWPVQLKKEDGKLVAPPFVE